MIAPTAIIRGVGLSFGVDVVDVEGTTGYYDSNINNKALKAIELITSDKYDYGFVHIKGIDDAGHDKSLKIKIEQLEKVDKAIGLLITELGSRSNEKNQYIVCVTGDHTTPVL
jgi:2,3-bisphosphoglycerate-independent phosphoglycerate mutase